MDEKPYEPVGVQFIDMKSGRDMMLCQDGSGFDGWILYRNHDGQWVSLRKATDDDLSRLNKARREVECGRPGRKPSK